MPLASLNILYKFFLETSFYGYLIYKENINGTDDWINIFIGYSKSSVCLVLPNLQD